MSIQRNESGKIIAQKPTFAWVEANAEEYMGWCLACGAEKDGCEPDARKYECDECGLRHVYGAEELVIMGMVL